MAKWASPWAVQILLVRLPVEEKNSTEQLKKMDVLILLSEEEGQVLSTARKRSIGYAHVQKTDRKIAGQMKGDLEKLFVIAQRQMSNSNENSQNRLCCEQAPWEAMDRFCCNVCDECGYAMCCRLALIENIVL